MDSQDAVTMASSSEIGKKDLVRRAICSRIIKGVYREGDKYRHAAKLQINCRSPKTVPMRLIRILLVLAFLYRTTGLALPLA